MEIKVFVQQEIADMSMISKVRVGIDDSQRLNYHSSDDVNHRDENIIEIQKVCDY